MRISIFALSFIFLISCGERQEIKQDTEQGAKPTNLNPAAYSFELLMFDTINKTDGRGLKQGKWITRKLPGHVVVESGAYKNNQKQGYWQRNNLKGEFMDSVYYEADVPTK
jgi:hypothetical protein